jgi:nucleoside-diphosphate-sugar epimerase
MAKPLDQDLVHILEKTGGLWEDLRGQRIFVTGGTGFFGKWLLSSLQRANTELGLDVSAVVLTRDPTRFAAQMPNIAEDRAFTFHPGDIQSFEYPDGEFRFVMHAATETDSVSSPIPRSLLFGSNVTGTRRVLEFARQARVRRLLYVSSGAVYGRQPLDISHITEDAPVAPDPMDVGAAYGHAKRASEFLIAAHAQETGCAACSARCFAFVGPHLPLDANFAIGNFIRDAMRGGPIQINGDGTPLRSYLYMADLAIWLWMLLLRGQSARAYNVGSDAAISIADLGRLVADVVNPRASVIVAQTPKAGVPPQRYVPSIARARSEHLLEPWIDLCKAVERTAAWYRGK